MVQYVLQGQGAVESTTRHFCQSGVKFLEEVGSRIKASDNVKCSFSHHRPIQQNVLQGKYSVHFASMPGETYRLFSAQIALVTLALAAAVSAMPGYPLVAAPAHPVLVKAVDHYVSTRYFV
jgi:hypothetical protein